MASPAQASAPLWLKVLVIVMGLLIVAGFVVIAAEIARRMSTPNAGRPPAASTAFTERIALGGGEHLRGFLEGRLRGDSAMVVTLDYRYPIWSFLDANLFVSVGNAFLGRFDALHLKRMMMNWGLALRTNTSRNVSLDIIVALGTNRFEQWDDNFRVDNVRATFGINQGF